uniref:Uncharacterized protein n=1 Tax=Gorilla gorilla gorilla TaxID=9595 RepID=A0A2I2ZUB4_GORGO
ILLLLLPQPPEYLFMCSLFMCLYGHLAFHSVLFHCSTRLEQVQCFHLDPNMVLVLAGEPGPEYGSGWLPGHILLTICWPLAS